MDTSRSAKRTKSIEVVPIDDTRARFTLSLDDIAHSPDGDEIIHSLKVSGEISLPDLVITAIEPVVDFQPYGECSASLAPVREMVGTRIGAGYRTRVLEVMGRTKGCTHFMTLMLDLATAHTLSIFLRMRSKATYQERSSREGEWMKAGLELEPRLENACVALRSESPVIRKARKTL